MSIDVFEDMPVWLASQQLALQAFNLTSADNSSLPATLRGRLEEAALGVSNHIAAATARGTAADILESLHSARAAAFETRSMLRLATALQPGKTKAFDEAAATARNCTDLLSEWTHKMQRGMAPLQVQTTRSRQIANLGPGLNP